jgi:hypothetical protein
MDRSATAVTAVTAVSVSLVTSGSFVADDTVAEFVSDAVCAGAVTTTLIPGAAAAVNRVGRVQVTETLPAFVQVHPEPVAETNVVPAGRVSVTETLAAVEGPAFAMLRE